jgi:hypothetical protein
MQREMGFKLGLGANRIEREEIRNGEIDGII